HQLSRGDIERERTKGCRHGPPGKNLPNPWEFPGTGATAVPILAPNPRAAPEPPLMMIRSLAIAGFALITTVAVGARHDVRAAAAPAGSMPGHPAALCGGEPCDAVARGLVAFLDRRPAGLDGNGRSCADCHMPTSAFQLSPADV